MKSEGLIKREDLHESLLQELDKVNTVTPAIGFGMNSVIKNAGRASASPKFTFYGKTIINLLGRDGNCEDISNGKFNKYGASTTIVLDSTAKVFGNNSVKLSSSATVQWQEIAKDISALLDKTKYYCMSGYVKNNDAQNMYVGVFDNLGTTLKQSPNINSTSFTRTFVKLQPSDLTNVVYAGACVTATALGQVQTGNVDGLMFEEITASQYADPNFVPSPYVDSYACLRNPYAEIRHNNIVRNGNTEEGAGWWVSNNLSALTSFTVENGKFKIVSSGSVSMYQVVNVKPNTDYYLAGNVSGGTDAKLSVVPATGAGTILTGSGTFNSGSNTQVQIRMSAYSALTATYDHIHLVEGTVAPAVYKSCELERVVLEGLFADGDIVNYDNGGVDGLVGWEHKALLGTEYGWQFNNDGTLAGCKKITLQMDKLVVPNTNLASSYSNVIETKPDGSINPTMNWGAFEASTKGCYINESGLHYILVPDTETGWAESVSPNSDEVRSFMSGWKAVSTDGTRYRAWVSVLDETVPLTGCVYSMNTSGNSAGTQITCDDSKYAVGDIIAFKMADGTWKSGTISSKGTGCVYVNAFTGTALAGYPVIKCDSSLSVVGKNNLAPNYEGYQIHFKSLSPKPITDSICHVDGDIPLIKEGDNYVLVDSGRVLGEVANIQINGDAFINGTGKPLANKVSKIITVYKSNIDDTANWIRGTSNSIAQPLIGNEFMSKLIADYNVSATAPYSVDYKILETQAPQIGTLSCEYVQDILGTLNKVLEEAENKQNKDSTLDGLVDKSMYEEIYLMDGHPVTWTITAGFPMVFTLFVPMSPKKAEYPNVNVKLGGLWCPNMGMFSDLWVSMVRVQKNGLVISVNTNNVTARTQVPASGVYVQGLGTWKITIDCKGKV